MRAAARVWLVVWGMWGLAACEGGTLSAEGERDAQDASEDGASGSEGEAQDGGPSEPDPDVKRPTPEDPRPDASLDAEPPRDASEDAATPREDAAPQEDVAPPQDAELTPDAPEEPPCQPRSCEQAGAQCGEIDDGCGHLIPCAACPSGMVCGGAAGPNRCVASCIPESRATTQGGGRCDDLAQAWTARGINVGYYPYRVEAPLEMYSGDYTGAPGAVFAAGPGRAGVLLQVIPRGAYVGLSTTGPWYDPPTGCLEEGASCGVPGRAACGDSSPPLRPPLAGFVWGYAYQGASHMQGWIPADFTRLSFAGFDPNHPCALGPAGADFEVHSACGAQTVCRGERRTCGATNPCTEGADDCGRAECGAMSGGALTPSAHRATVTRPSGVHVCERTPPHESVRCLENGGERDFFFVYPFGAYLYWAQNSTTKHWLHYGDRVQSYYHARDAQGVLWDFVEVTSSGAPTLTPVSDGAGAGGGCSAENPDACEPCRNGGTCGWIQSVFLR